MYRCRLCGYAARSFAELLIHIERQCSKISGVICPVCGRVFRRERDMKMHLARKSILYYVDYESREHFDYIVRRVD